MWQKPPTGSPDKPVTAETDALNGAVTPKVSRGGGGIREALDDGDPISLKKGEYVLDEPLKVGDDRLRGLGRRGKTILRASSDFPSGRAIIETESGQHTPVIEGVDIDCRGKAQDGIIIGEGSRDFTLRNLRIRHGYRDGIRFKGAFNGLVQQTRIRRCNRAGIVLGDNGSFRASSMKFVKCHVDLIGEPNNSYSSASHPSTVGFLGLPSSNNPFGDGYAEATQSGPNVHLTNCDISNADVGLYIGEHMGQSTVRGVDCENNLTGVQIGGPSTRGYVPREVTLLGGTSNNNTEFGYDLFTGVNVTLIGLAESGSSTGLRVGADLGGGVSEMNCRFDDGKTTNGALNVIA